MTVCCLGHYREILGEALECLHESRLYDKSQSLELAVLGAPEDRLVVERMIRAFPKIRVACASDDVTDDEFPALELAQSVCRERHAHIYYLHTKGIPPSGANQYERWRAFMLHHVVERHAECIEALATHSVAGTNWCGGHFSGNFWWARSEHLRSLPSLASLRHDPTEVAADPTRNVQRQWESWIGLTQGQFKNFGPEGLDLSVNARWGVGVEQVVTWLLVAQGGTRCLELGDGGAGLGQIDAALRHSVPSREDATFGADQLEFLESNLGEAHYDVIVIDEALEEDRVLRLIEAALPRTAPHGSIVVRYTNPPTSWFQRPAVERASSEAWCGCAWKAMVRFRRAHPEMSAVTVDTDWGCGVIRPHARGRARLDLLDADSLSYERLEESRATWLNVVTPRRFQRDLHYLPWALGRVPLASRTDVINALVSRYGLEAYLEIGVQDPALNWGRVLAPYRQSVDPAAEATFRMTSDEFFAQGLGCETYDIVFVDGLHEASQCLRDIENALARLSPHGYIVVHDSNPPTEWHQRPPEEYQLGTDWNGTVWKAIVAFRQRHRECEVFTVDVDWGCAVIHRAPAPPPPVMPDFSQLDWKAFEQNRNQWLNLISCDEFRARLLE